MSRPFTVLMLGASYGSLLAAKLLMAGHDVHLVCLPAESDAISRDGIRIRMPIRGRSAPIEISPRDFMGSVSVSGTGGIDPRAFDLVVLAMQEPQYSAPGVRELLDAVACSQLPCLSIMNMPPLPYLARIPGLDVDGLRSCTTDCAVWDNFDPALMTLCSPDPQAFRPPGEPVNVLQVSLPTNFKAARFESEDDTAMLRQMQADIEAIRFDTDDDRIELPVKLKVHDSVFVPLAKWAMLLTGNYRCIQADGPRSIKDAVHTDLEASRAIFTWVNEVCRACGAAADDLVPFEKYAKAAQGLTRPSSAARALFAGAKTIERVDRLVQAVAAQKNMQSEEVHKIVSIVDHRLASNRRLY